MQEAIAHKQLSQVVNSEEAIPAVIHSLVQDGKQWNTMIREIEGALSTSENGALDIVLIINKVRTLHIGKLMEKYMDIPRVKELYYTLIGRVSSELYTKKRRTASGVSSDSG